MIKRILRTVKSIFSSSEGERVFSHQAMSGETCAVCGKPMLKKHSIWRVRSGEKMHSNCWPKFFEARVESMKKLTRGKMDA